MVTLTRTYLFRPNSDIDQVPLWYGPLFTVLRFNIFEILILRGSTSVKLTSWLRLNQTSSVTRSGDFLDSGQLFKAFGNN